jgi:hypothetical protein
MRANLIFSDASYHPQLKLGIGGFFVFMDQEVDGSGINLSLNPQVHFLEMHDTNNIRAEIATVIASLSSYLAECVGPKTHNLPLIVYSDCKSVCELSQRRQKLEARQFQSLRRATPLSNSDLYREFFAYYDELNPQFIWLKGHTPRRERDQIQSIFATLDHAVRRELRAKVKILPPENQS